jgi:cytidyltransferase-like protein|tara:strand:+ start:6628 stop:7083 length:456 start_codon:yes stop_codon:yes gene_type:complete
MSKVISIVSGGFDPIHPGHIMMMEECKKFSDYLIVGVNSNKWLTRKKGNFFMDINHRLYVVSRLKSVEETMEFNDDDETASDLLRKVFSKYKKEKIVFANGGDRSDPSKVRELKVAEELGIELKFGVGGNHKESSSSDLLGRWKKFILESN